MGVFFGAGNMKPGLVQGKDGAVDNTTFINALYKASEECYNNSVAHGFWAMGADNRNKGEQIALMHSELSEMLEAVRKPGFPDEHCPSFNQEEVEAADLLIRLLDYAYGHGLMLGAATVAKMDFNRNRPYKHGKGF